jgi:Tol biopolymer transport system component
MLWHTGGARHENPDARVLLYDVEQQRATAVLREPGRHLAPAWSPSGEDWLAVSTDTGRNQLQYFGTQGVKALMTTDNDEIVFSWSPTSRHVAYAVRERGAESVYGPIHIWDLYTGLTSEVTDVGFRILGFFWSPDGQRLAYLTHLGLPTATWTQWRTVDLVTGQDRGFATFHPSPHMRRIVIGFSQYAQSHRFWSPDGRFLVYSDRDEALVDRVWLVDTWADRDVQPIWVAEGCLGDWSWD